MIITTGQGRKRLRSLDELFADDDLGLLDNVEAKKPSLSQDDKDRHALEPLLNFVREHKRLPRKEGTFDEAVLARQFASMQKRNSEQAQLIEGILAQEKGERAYTPYKPRVKTEAEPDPEHKKEASESHAGQRSAAPTVSECESSAEITEAEMPAVSDAEEIQVYSSLEDIFNEEDDLGLLEGVDLIRELPGEHAPAKTFKSKESAARAERCRDFELYAAFFNDVKVLLRQGALALRPFKGYEHDPEPGRLFIVNGLYAMVSFADKENVVQRSHRKEYRIRVILSNETEVSPFVNSFYERLNDDTESREIVAINAEGEEFCKNLRESLEKINALKNDPAASNKQNLISGHLYILKSLSRNPEILRFKQSSELIKIGFCTTSVETRIANAEHEPTYLCAPVQIVRDYTCKGIDPHQFEKLVHALLCDHRLNVTVTDEKGKSYQPREWFTVSVKTACELVDRILDNTIMQYRVDPLEGRLIKVK